MTNPFVIGFTLVMALAINGVLLHRKNFISYLVNIELTFSEPEVKTPDVSAVTSYDHYGHMTHSQLTIDKGSVV